MPSGSASSHCCLPRTPNPWEDDHAWPTARPWRPCCMSCAPAANGSGSRAAWEPPARCMIAFRNGNVWGGAQLWRTEGLAYDELKGLDWTWQAMEGAMPKAPLGGKSDGAQSDRPWQAGDQAESADRRPRHSRGG